jgi:hypothetical protein
MTAHQLAVPLTLPLDGVAEAAPIYSASVQQLLVQPPQAEPIGTRLNEPPTLALALVGVAAVAVFRGLHKRIARRPSPVTIVQPATRKNSKASKSQPGRKKQQQGRKPIKPRRRAA